MKSSAQKKRKVAEVSQENKKQKIAVEKKPENRKSWQRQKSEGGCKSFLPENDQKETPSTSAGKELSNKSQFIAETSSVQEFNSQAGQNHTTKIKLQLFPVSSAIRSILQKDGHNPFLELTLSVRKKISSVIRHLNTKWGNSSAAVGELMLFPYDVGLEDINLCRRWTSHCGGITTGELHGALGSPSIFRLRYGWFSNFNVEASGVSCKSTAVHERSETKNIGNDCNVFRRMTCDQIDKSNVTSQEIRNTINVHEVEDATMTEQMPPPLPVNHVGDDAPERSLGAWDDSLTGLSIGGLLSEASLLNKINYPAQKFEGKSNLQPIELVSDISMGALLTEASLLEKINNPKQRSGNNSSLQPTQPVSDIFNGGMLSEASSQNKIDNLCLKTVNESGSAPILSSLDISIGGLPSEASLQGKINAFDATSNRKSLELKPTAEKGAVPSLFPWDDSLTSLSIGGLLSESSLQAKFDGCDPKSKEISSSLQMPPLLGSFSSILDAEETCHAFSFKKLTSLSKDPTTSNQTEKSGGCCNGSKLKTSRLPRMHELNNRAKLANEPAQKAMTNSLPHYQGLSEDSSPGLTAIQCVTTGGDMC